MVWSDYRLWNDFRCDFSVCPGKAGRIEKDMLLDFMLFATPIAIFFCRYHHFPLMRFLIEGLRTDSLYLFPGLRISQLLSLVLMCVGIFLWFWGVQKDKFTTEYRGKYRFS